MLLRSQGSLSIILLMECDVLHFDRIDRVRVSHPARHKAQHTDKAEAIGVLEE